MTSPSSSSYSLRRIGKTLRLTGSSALALSTICSNLVRIVSTVCLTRLLSPEVYGITGLVISVFYVIHMLSDLGFQAYVVRHEQTDDPVFIDAVWTVHSSRGIGMAVVAALLAWPLSLFLHKPELTAPLIVSSCVLAIEGQMSLNQFRALREGRVQRFALIDLLTNTTQAFAAILIACFVHNIWAIVASMFVGSFVRVWASYALFNSNRHVFRVDVKVARDLWQFSRAIAASSALTLVITQFDKLAMSRILSLSQFGTYVIAGALASAPTGFAYNYASNIIYPAVAAAWRAGDSLKNAYYRCWRRFFYLYAFGGGVLVGASDLVIRILYDSRYQAAARYLSILSVGTAITIATQSKSELFVASGRTRIGVEFNLIRLGWLLAGAATAIVQQSVILFVGTIGLKEVPVYLYASWLSQRQQLLRWPLELALAVVILCGVALGEGVSVLGQIYF